MSKLSQRFTSNLSEEGGSGGGSSLGGSVRQLSLRSMSSMRGMSQRVGSVFGRKRDDILVDEDLESVPEIYFEMNKGNQRKALQQVRMRMMRKGSGS